MISRTPSKLRSKVDENELLSRPPSVKNIRDEKNKNELFQLNQLKFIAYRKRNDYGLFRENGLFYRIPNSFRGLEK